MPLPGTPFSAMGVVFMNNKLIWFRTSCTYIYVRTHATRVQPSSIRLVLNPVQPGLWCGHGFTHIHTYRYILVIQNNNTMDNRIEKCPQHTHMDSMFQCHQSICSGLTEGKHCTTPSMREGGREICNLGIVLPATCIEIRNDQKIQNTQAAPLNTHATPTITMPAARVQFPGA